MSSVVIVDDQSAMRAMLRRALERHGGFDVREASDGRSAVDSKAVVLSGHSLKAGEAIQAGADLFLPKTTSARSLIAELVDILRSRPVEPSGPSPTR